MAKYFEDYRVGDRLVSPGRTVTEADVSILLGICRYSEPIMIDEEYAKTTRFGGRIVQGRVALALAGGLIVLGRVFDDETTICAVETKNVRYVKPLRIGDTIRMEVEFIDKKETSKADEGLVTHKEICKNQKSETILEVEETHLVRRRPI
jgi:3-hydroxybutyryl-CoA dehydratase